MKIYGYTAKNNFLPRNLNLGLDSILTELKIAKHINISVNTEQREQFSVLQSEITIIDDSNKENYPEFFIWCAIVEFVKSQEHLEKLSVQSKMNQQGLIFEELFEAYACAEEDRDYYKAIVEGVWPNADERIKSKREAYKMNQQEFFIWAQIKQRRFILFRYIIWLKV